MLRGIEVLAEFADRPALVQKGNVMAASFHPELTSDTTVHRRFLELAKQSSQPNGHGSKPSPAKANRKPAKSKRRG